MKGVIVRSAREDDAVAIAILSSQLGYPSTEQEVQNRLVRILRYQDHAVFVAEAGNTPVGWIHLFIARFIESDPYVEIGGLVVDEKHRRLGIGRELVRTGEQWALQEKGLLTIRVRTNILRKESHFFYRGLGYTELKQQMVYRKALKGPSQPGRHLA